MPRHYVLKDHYIDIDGVLAEINGLEYEIPYIYHTDKIRITDDSEHRFVLRDGEGKVLKILTDKMLREYSFGEDGTLKKEITIASTRIGKSAALHCGG